MLLLLLLLHLLGAFGASFCAEVVKNAQNFRACGGQGGLRRFLIGNRSYTLHATFAARVVTRLSKQVAAFGFSCRPGSLMIRLRPSLDTSHLRSSDGVDPTPFVRILVVVAGPGRRARRSIGTAVLLQHHCAMYHCSKQSNAPRRSTAPRRFTARIAKPPLQRAKPLRLAEPIRLPLVGRGWRTRRAQRGPCYRASDPTPQQTADGGSRAAP